MLSGTILIAVLILTKLGVRWRWVIDKTEFLFFVLLRESWMLIVSKKNSRSENSLQPHSVQFHVPFFDFRDNKLWNDFFYCNLNKTFHMLAISLWDGSNCICWLFPSGMEAIAKFTFLIYLFWIFIRRLVIRFPRFIKLVEVDRKLGLEDFKGMFSSFLSSMSSTNGSWKGDIRFS